MQAPAQFSRVFWFLSHTCPLVQTKAESAGVFILWDGNLRSQEIALLLVEVVHKLEKLALMHQTPFIAKIYRDRSVKLWKSRKQLLKILK